MVGLAAGVLSFVVPVLVLSVGGAGADGLGSVILFFAVVATWPMIAGLVLLAAAMPVTLARHPGIVALILAVGTVSATIYQVGGIGLLMFMIQYAVGIPAACILYVAWSNASPLDFPLPRS